MVYRWAFPIFLCTLLVTAVVASTQHKSAPQLRVYKEIVLASSEMPEDSQSRWSQITAVMPNHPPIEGMPTQMPEGSSAASSLNWTVPNGWNEQPASGMRLASFISGELADPVECSIVRLSGPAGGRDANIRRWLGQIHLPELNDNDLRAFLDRQEKLTVNKTYQALLVDFTQLQTNLPSDTPSTIAVIIDMSGDSVFVKMTGSKAAVQNHVLQLRELALSIKPGESLR